MQRKEGSILIIDDNKELLLALKMLLSKYFNEIKTESSPKVIPSMLSNNSFDIILLDMNFSAGVNTGNEGFYWKNKILKHDPDACIVFITAYGDIELAVKAMKEGAIDFIHKSWDEDKILSTILSAYKLRQSKVEISKLKKQQKHLAASIHGDEFTLQTGSPAMQGLYKTVAKVASTNANVLITGENGTGKEVIARLIHRQSMRKDKIFVHVDLGALNENLFESELFGHEKGAFTGADEAREGRFELADGGTLFLDEIGNLPLSLQSKLLTAIQKKTVVRLGSSRPVETDIRLVCATNKNLGKMISEGSFREDLLYRINTIHLELPPLRERKEDIAPLAEFALNEFAAKYDRKSLKLSLKAHDKLLEYNWPGNIRELRHVIEKAVILAETNVIYPTELGIDTKARQTVHHDTYNLEENEKRIIAAALNRYQGNISITAKNLGINRTTLYAKIRKYGL